MAVDGNYRYDAFISYRHIEPDREWAKWLRSALETYRVPKPLVVKGVARRVKRVFRDEEEVSAGANLSEEVQVALDASRYLIVVCSPRVVESRWCNAEIQHFRDRGWHNRILALLIEGEPYESFPPALREIRRTIVREDGERIEEVEEVEPLAADVRESPEESTRLRKGTAKLRLLARILGCRFDDLRQRDAHRRQRRLTVFASALATLVLGVGVLAAWAFFQKSRAETAERVAVDREADARERLAHSLVFQADTYAEKEDWLDAKSNYMEALGIYEELDRSTELVDMAMVEVQRHAPTSVYSYRHPKDPLHCIAASADGTLVVLGTRGGKLILWDVVAGRMEKTVGDTRMPMSCLDLSPDGKLALVGGEDGTVLLHALDANATMHTRRVGNGPVRTVRFSPDGTALLAAGADHRLTVWEVDGKERFSVDAKPLLDADWSPDGHGIATGGMPEKGLLSGTRWVPGRYWNAKTGRLSLELKPKSLADVSVRIVRFAANGEILAAVGGRIIRWRAADGRIAGDWEAHDTLTVAIERGPGGSFYTADSRGVSKFWLNREAPAQTWTANNTAIRDIARVAGGSLLALDSEGVLRLWPMSSTPRRFAGPAGFNVITTELAFSPGGGLVAASFLTPRVVRVWHVETGQTVLAADTPLGRMRSIRFLDNETLIASGDGGRLYFWDLVEGSQRRVLDLGSDVFAMDLFDGGSSLLVGDRKGRVAVWDLRSGERKRELAKANGHTAQDVAASRDGRLALCGFGNGATRLWDLSTGKLLHSWEGHGKGVREVAISESGSLAYACYLDGQVAAWDTTDGGRRVSLAGGVSTLRAAISTRKRRIAMSSGKNLAIYDLETGRKIREFQGEAPHGGAVFDSGGARLLTSRSSALALWDFRVPARHREARARMDAARRKLRKTARDGAALAELAEAYRRLGNTAFAALCFERAAGLGREIDSVRLAETYTRLGNLDKAEKVVAGLAGGPADPRVRWIVRGLAYAFFHRAGRSKEPDKATADYDHAVRLYPRSSRFLLVRGLHHEKNGRSDAARGDYLKAMRLSPDSVLPYRSLARLHVRAKKLKKAIEVLSAGLERIPTSVDLLMSRALLHMAQTRRSAAIVDYRRASELLTTSKTLLPLARLLRAEKRFDEAIRALDTLLRQNRDDLAARFERANAFYDQRRFEDAAKDYGLVIERSEQLQQSADLRIDAYNSRGNCWVGLIRFEEAISDYTRALEGRPGTVWMLTNRASAFRMVRRWDNAIADGEKAVELAPDAISPIRQLGFTRLYKGDFAGARAAFERVLRLAPDDTDSLAGLGSAIFGLGDHVRASEIIEKILARDPTSYNRACALCLRSALEGTADRNRGEYLDAAVRHFRKALSESRGLVLAFAVDPDVAPLRGDDARFGLLLGTLPPRTLADVAAHFYRIGDTATARSWAERALVKGDGKALNLMGIMAKDPKEAIRWLERAVATGYPAAFFNLGQSLWEGTGVQRDRSKAMEWFEKGAHAGHADCQTWIGWAHLGHDSGRERDLEKAIGWLRKAVAQDHPGAQYVLGLMYVEGEGVDQDLAEGGRLLRKSAEQGNLEAMFRFAHGQANLADRQSDSDKAVWKRIEAAYWYGKAADLGHLRAAARLGQCYLEGLGMVPNHERGLQWSRQAAEKGIALAFRILGDAYSKGRGVERSTVQAIEWYEKSLAAGDASSRHGLALLRCERGEWDRAEEQLATLDANETTSLQLWYVRMRAGKGEQAARGLRKYRDGPRRKVDPTWNTYAAYALGELTQAKLLVTARLGLRVSDPSLVRADLCKAHLLIATRRFAEGDREAAITHLRECVDTRAVFEFAYDFAGWELRRLAESK